MFACGAAILAVHLFAPWMVAHDDDEDWLRELLKYNREAPL
jgi:hypothetical protein